RRPCGVPQQISYPARLLSCGTKTPHRGPGRGPFADGIPRITGTGASAVTGAEAGVRNGADLRAVSGQPAGEQPHPFSCCAAAGGHTACKAAVPRLDGGRGYPAPGCHGNGANGSDDPYGARGAALIPQISSIA